MGQEESDHCCDGFRLALGDDCLEEDGGLAVTDVLLLTPQRQERLSDCSALLELERKVRNRRGVLTQPPGPRTTRFLTVSLPPLSRPSLPSTGLPSVLTPGPEDVGATTGRAGGGAEGEDTSRSWTHRRWLRHACSVVMVFYLPTNSWVGIVQTILEVA